MVSVGHYGAAHAAFAVLEAGGNAVDAAVAGGIALGVLQPDIVNVAGVAPIMLRMAGGEVWTIAGLGHWSATTDPELFLSDHRGAIPDRRKLTCCSPSSDYQARFLNRHGATQRGGGDA